MTSPTAVRTSRDLVTAVGPDALTFLQGQLSQDLTKLAPGEATWSFLLQPQGKVDAWLRVHRAGHEEFRLDVDTGSGAAVVARLERFKLRTKCDFTLAEATPVLAVRGAMVEGGLSCGWPGLGGVDLIGIDADEIPPGVGEADTAWLESVRVRAGVPRMGVELTEATIPAEVGQWIIDLSVSFTKGCFTGQELVARIDSRGGNVPRRLRAIVAGQALAAGAAVQVDGTEVGRITSVAGPVGLAYIQRKVEPPTEGEVDGMPVAVRELPIDE
jgi:folate-binding protein YgfZ